MAASHTTVTKIYRPASLPVAPKYGHAVKEKMLPIQPKTIFALIFCLVSLSANGSAIQKADIIVVYKSKSKLLLKLDGKTIKEYKVVFGNNPKGQKQRLGDGRTPEGRYLLDYKNSHSAFYKSIHVSYPNEEDRRRARNLGVEPGGDIMIHGQKNGFGWLGFAVQWFNWTDGCIAVKNSDMDDIWNAVDAGTPIEIYP